MNTINLNTRLIDLTVGQLVEVIAKAQYGQTPSTEKKEDRKLVYGLDGLARLFGCSKRTAQNIKDSGKIDKAIMQNGRKIIVDANLALELFGKAVK